MDQSSGSYAPRSPDLSAFYQPNDSPSASLYPQRESFSLPQSSAAFFQEQQHHSQHLQPPLPQNDFLVKPDPLEFQPWPADLEPQGAFPPQPLFPGDEIAPSPTSMIQPNPTPGRGRGRRKQSATAGDLPPPAPPLVPESRPSYPGEAENIIVRTKFPVARIKRIVQADEDVGKVAQVTPVVVSKALELFMISLALKSADEARLRGSKRVTGKDLKTAVGKEGQFDFLNDIVSKVSDGPGKSGGAAGKKSDDEADDTFGDEDMAGTGDENAGGAAASARARRKKGGASAAATPAKRRRRKATDRDEDELD